MDTRIGIGFSQKLDILEAAEEAVSQAILESGKSKIDLAIIYSTIHYDPNEFVPVIQENLKGTKIIGCSTAGIITSNLIAMRGIAVLAITSERTHFAVGAVEQIEQSDLRLAGQILARNTIQDYGQHSRKAFVYFADGLVTDNSQILRGIQDVFGNVFPIVGAGASDDFHFKRTHQFCNNRIFTHSAAGFLMGGHLDLGLGSRHGWKPIGKPRFIDKSEGNIIKSIDGKPAAKIYDEYFGEQAKNLRATKLGQMAILYPLGIYIEGEDEYLLRNAISIQNDDSILCQGHIPDDSEVHIMIANKESCIQAAIDAALHAQNGLKGKPAKLVLIIESLARHKLLGRSAFQEIKAIKDVFGYNVPLLGMYSYGEVCPSRSLEDIDKLHLQNESITILAIG